MLLAGLRRFINKADPSQFLSPIGVSVLACFLALAFAFWVGLPIVSLLNLPWAAPLVFMLMPVVVTFIILYQSCWHNEMVWTTRALLVSVYSILIFGGVLIGGGVILILGSLAYVTLFQSYSQIHY